MVNVAQATTQSPSVGGVSRGAEDTRRLQKIVREYTELNTLLGDTDGVAPPRELSHEEREQYSQRRDELNRELTSALNSRREKFWEDRGPFPLPDRVRVIVPSDNGLTFENPYNFDDYQRMRDAMTSEQRSFIDDFNSAIVRDVTPAVEDYLVADTDIMTQFQDKNQYDQRRAKAEARVDEMRSDLGDAFIEQARRVGHIESEVAQRLGISPTRSWAIQNEQSTEQRQQPESSWVDTEQVANVPNTPTSRQSQQKPTTARGNIARRSVSEAVADDEAQSRQQVQVNEVSQTESQSPDDSGGATTESDVDNVSAEAESDTDMSIDDQARQNFRKGRAPLTDDANPMRGKWREGYEGLPKEQKKLLRNITNEHRKQRGKYQDSFRNNGRNNPFLQKKSRKERMAGINNNHHALKADMVSSVVRPLESGVHFNAVANVATTAMMVYMLSPEFRRTVSPWMRDKTEEHVKDVRENMSLRGKSKNFFASVKNRARDVKDSAMKLRLFDKRVDAIRNTEGRVPMDIEAAADTLVGVNEQAYEAMRYTNQPGEVKRQYKETVKDLYSQWKSDGLNISDINKRAYDKVAERIAEDPGYASRFDQTAFGGLHPDQPTQGKDGTLSFSGQWRDINRNRVVDTGKSFLTVREPTDVVTHQSNIGSSFACDFTRLGNEAPRNKDGKPDLRQLHESVVGYFSALENPALLIGGEDYPTGEPTSVREASQRRARGFYQNLMDDGYTQQDALKMMSNSYGQAMAALRQENPQVFAEYQKHYGSALESDVAKFNESLVASDEAKTVFPASFDVQDAAIARQEEAEQSAQPQQQREEVLHRPQRDELEVDREEQSAQQSRPSRSLNGSAPVTEESREDKRRRLATRARERARQQSQFQMRSLSDQMDTGLDTQARSGDGAQTGQPERQRVDDRSRTVEQKATTKRLADTHYAEQTLPKQREGLNKAEERKTENVVHVPDNVQTPGQRSQSEAYNSDYARNAEQGTDGGVKIRTSYDNDSTVEEEGQGYQGKKQTASASRSRTNLRVRRNQAMIEAEESQRQHDAAEHEKSSEPEFDF